MSRKSNSPGKRNRARLFPDGLPSARGLGGVILKHALPHLSFNQRDPLEQGLDFSTLDAMADRLWGETAAP